MYYYVWSNSLYIRFILVNVLKNSILENLSIILLALFTQRLSLFQKWNELKLNEMFWIFFLGICGKAWTGGRSVIIIIWTVITTLPTPAFLSTNHFNMSPWWDHHNKNYCLLAHSHSQIKAYQKIYTHPSHPTMMIIVIIVIIFPLKI